MRGNSGRMFVLDDLKTRPRRFFPAILATLPLLFVLAGAGAADAQSVAFRQSVAEAAAGDEAVAAFYQDRNYDAIWTDADDAARRTALLQSGYVYHYAFAMLIGVVALLSWYLLT